MKCPHCQKEILKRKFGRLDILAMALPVALAAFTAVCIWSGHADSTVIGAATMFVIAFEVGIARKLKAAQ